ncbi:uncharacterized protein LOC111295733 isoform X2 [Durio zibethinus]|uniref:Uncharacterized protein LOC111295733 isoform X2 n=1 Tax=Durio zibethinus TaxID=66656 RepID=A0A6P5YXD4_DURZI|nr:uncharacterized protein LOC111295733 isoform X2 [Durio zibethinus]
MNVIHCPPTNMNLLKHKIAIIFSLFMADVSVIGTFSCYEEDPNVKLVILKVMQPNVLALKRMYLTAGRLSLGKRKRFSAVGDVAAVVRDIWAGLQGCMAMLLDKDKNSMVDILFPESSTTCFHSMKFQLNRLPFSFASGSHPNWRLLLIV